MMAPMNRTTTTKEDTMKAKTADRLKDRGIMRKQIKPTTYWSATLKRKVTVPE
jgi:hypothetical protein